MTEFLEELVIVLLFIGIFFALTFGSLAMIVWSLRILGVNI